MNVSIYNFVERDRFFEEGRFQRVVQKRGTKQRPVLVQRVEMKSRNSVLINSRST